MATWSHFASRRRNVVPVLLCAMAELEFSRALTLRDGNALANVRRTSPIVDFRLFNVLSKFEHVLKSTTDDYTAHRDIRRRVRGEERRLN